MLPSASGRLWQHSPWQAKRPGNFLITAACCHVLLSPPLTLLPSPYIPHLTFLPQADRHILSVAYKTFSGLCMCRQALFLEGPSTALYLRTRLQVKHHRLSVVGLFNRRWEHCMDNITPFTTYPTAHTSHTPTSHLPLHLLPHPQPTPCILPHTLPTPPWELHNCTLPLPPPPPQPHTFPLLHTALQNLLLPSTACSLPPCNSDLRRASQKNVVVTRLSPRKLALSCWVRHAGEDGGLGWRHPRLAPLNAVREHRDVTSRVLTTAHPTVSPALADMRKGKQSRHYRLVRTSSWLGKRRLLYTAGTAGSCQHLKHCMAAYFTTRMADHTCRLQQPH